MAARDPHPELPVDPDDGAGVDVRPVHLRPVMVAAVLAGGLLGTPVRYTAQLWWPAAGGWPWGTFGVNVCGSLVLGVLLEALARAGSDTGRRRLARLLFGTGMLGSVTTYSSMVTEVDLLTGQRWGLAAVYGVVSVAAGVLAAAVGIAVAARAHHVRTSRTARQAGGRR